MKKRTSFVSVGLVLFASLFVSPVFADMSLGQVLAEGGVQAVGAAAKGAAEAAYASSDDPAVVPAKLTSILNEAVATGDEGAIRYAIVAIMMVGGAENLLLSQAAINDSDAFTQYPKLTAFTVSAAKTLIGPSNEKGGGEAGGAGAGGGGMERENAGGGKPRDNLGGGSSNPFDPESGGIIDLDSEVTDT